MPIFSIIIPAYNSEKFIDSTLRSVLKQTFSDFEIIVVDDGSKDNTKNILEKYARKDERIKIIRTPNSGGPATPTNIGVNMARGDYVAFLDHDDSWKPEKLKKLYDVFKNNEHAGFVLSDIEIYNEADKSITQVKAPVTNKKLSFYNLLAGNYFNTFSMMAVRRNILERVGAIDTNLTVFPDYDMVVRLISHDVDHFFINEPLVIYRVHQHNSSSMALSSTKRIADLERIILKYAKLFQNNKKSLSKIHQAIGRIYLNLGEKEKAISSLKTSAKNDPYNPAVYFRLFSSYFGEFPYRILRKVKNETLRRVS